MRISPPIQHSIASAAIALVISNITPTYAASAAAIFDAHLESKKFSLYEDPYNGNEILIGGFSGLYPHPGRSDRFYVITDRGPAPEFRDANGTFYKTWALPGFGPQILTVDLQPNLKAKIRDVVSLTRPDGSAISGLPTSLPFTDTPFDFNLNQLPFDEDSLDAEGITMDPWGNFWVCEEYKPSIAKVASNGRVLMRLVPAGTLTGSEQVPTFDVLPAVLSKRRANRGFEGIAASANGMLYAILQRPLNNPSQSAANANGNGRIVAIDLHALNAGNVVVRQYIYPMPPGNSGVTVSDLYSTGPGKLLVPERGTDKLMEIDLANATDITPLERPDGKLVADPTKTIEQLNGVALAANGIVPVAKITVIESLTAISPLLEKVEGVCVVGNFIVLTYDNDFNVADAGSIPESPLPNGPLVELNLVGNNMPKFFVVPRP